MTNEQKAKLTGTIVRFALYAVVAILAIPFTIMAIKGWLLLLALVGIIGGTLTLAPALDMAARNWRLKLIKDQAAKHPVESMQNIYEGKLLTLKQASEALRVQRGERAVYLSKLKTFKERYPAQADYWDSAADRLTELLRLNEQKYAKAQQITVAYGEQVEQTRAIWEIGLAAARANKAVAFTEDDFLTKIKNETAIESVQQQMEVAFADLDQSLLETQSKKPAGTPLPPDARAEFQKALT